jgi:hypothetical protein
VHVSSSGTPELGGQERQLPFLPFTWRGKGGEGVLLIKGKYLLLLIQRIRSCYYRTI